MPEFIFRGQVTLRGVEFFIQAKNKMLAKKAAKLGHYDSYDIGAAETTDWEIEGEGELNA